MLGYASRVNSLFAMLAQHVLDKTVFACSGYLRTTGNLMHTPAPPPRFQPPTIAIHALSPQVSNELNCAADHNTQVPAQ